MKHRPVLCILIVLLLVPALCLVLYLAAASCPARERDYAEEAAYWKQVYDGLREQSQGKIVEERWLGQALPAVPGVTSWGPKVMHVALLDTDMKYWDIRPGEYDNVLFPLYCGYFVFDQNRDITFVRKTDLRVKIAMTQFAWGEDGKATWPKGDDDFIGFRMKWLVPHRINAVQLFFGLYGMDFVPKFKHRYPFGQRPEGMSDSQLLELENEWSPPWSRSGATDTPAP